MKRTRLVPLVLAIVLATGTPASAWDPFADELAATAEDPAPFTVPDGIYVVTEVYTGDVVTSSGTTTTYTTTTASQTPGTYARVVDVVATGAASAYDGRSMNGRAALPDGRLVAGTYYEDFVLTSEGYIAVNIVFFQDDSVTVVVPVPTSTPPAAPVASTPPPSSSWLPQPTAAPFPGPYVEPTPTPRPSIAIVTAVGSAGVALAPGAPVLAAIEVLRGRRVALWPRAFVNGNAVPLRTWRLSSGRVDVAPRLSGDATVPCDVTWLTLAPAGASWRLRFELTSDALPGQVLTATIDVLVRSPALGE